MPATLLSSEAYSAMSAQGSTAAEPGAPVRIASLLPGLTDIIHDLQQSAALVATSHECDSKNTLAKAATFPKLQTEKLPPDQISAGWNAAHAQYPPLHHLLAATTCSFYHTNAHVLQSTRPTILLTHLTPPSTPLHPSESELRAALHALLPSLITIISAAPTTLSAIYELHHRIAAALSRPHISLNPVSAARARLHAIASRPTSRARVAVVQWTDPLYLAGDWIPEVVTLSAAGDGFTKPGAPSIPVHPADLKRVDIVLFAVCALDLRACQMVVNRFWRQNAHTLRVWTGKLVAVDASRLFSRPALSTVVKSAEVIAEVVADYPIFGHGNSVWKLWTPP